MKNPIDNFWKLKFKNVKAALESNNFEVFVADTSKEASKIVLEDHLASHGYQKHIMGRFHDIYRNRSL